MRITIGIADHAGKSPEKSITAPVAENGKVQQGMPLSWIETESSFSLACYINGEWMEVPCVRKP